MDITINTEFIILMPKREGILKLKMKNNKMGDWFWFAAAAAKSLQSCPILCEPIDGSPPGSPIPGILWQEHWRGLPFPSPMQKSEK